MLYDNGYHTVVPSTAPLMNKKDITIFPYNNVKCIVLYSNIMYCMTHYILPYYTILPYTKKSPLGWSEGQTEEICAGTLQNILYCTVFHCSIQYVIMYSTVQYTNV